MTAPAGQGEAAAPELHPDVVPLSWLLGTWLGVGVGGYPTIEDFPFAQEVSFAHDGRPFLSYASRSWLLDDEGNRVRQTGRETGFWRARPGNEVEVLLAHPTGFAEVWIGEVTVTGMVDSVITAARVELRTDVVARTASAKEVTGGHRLYGLVDGALLWAYDMAAVGQPITSHLSARLQKVS